ncbi:Cu(I)-responsive transcriptional regulator [Deefgea salmonis]|uniref:Cu(I)-responsive transcriptional regulator n=1 Tax=Deefgea salmonis TaxID=2875502 RepID=A0ABS8BNJ6_9NEIS|nr:Cu(I)-responsive transcriptional regulator [Deefgea salmonis]MCB5197318.1 Cu(I)-responsive transcriptional regulator [Deefgea salmonis]
MNIGQAATLSGLSSKMIRHYESIGLIKPKGRSAAGYRIYNEFDLSQLRFIHQTRQFGFSLEQIGQLLMLWNKEDRASIDVKKLAEQHILMLNSKIQAMQQMQSTLAQFVEICPASDDSNCPILNALAGGQWHVSEPCCAQHELI